MADRLRWIFEMVNRVSGPARAARRSMGDFIQTVHSGLASVQLLTQGAETMGRVLVAGIEPAIRREKSLGAFTTLLGDAADAERMYAKAVKFAAATPFQTADVVDSYKKLLVAQFKETEVPIVMKIIGDAASMAESPAEAMNTVIQQMGQMRSLGKMTMEDAKPIMQATMMRGDLLYKNIAEVLGLTVEQAKAAQSAGKISADVGTFAMLKTLSEQFSGNMEQASQQVAGLVSTIASRPTEFLERLQDTRGYDALRDALKSVADTFSPASERGQQLSQFINELGSGILERVADGLDMAASSAIAMADGFSIGFGSFDENLPDEERTKRFAENMRDIGAAAGTASKAFLSLASGMSDTYDWMYRIGQWIDAHPLVQRLVFGLGGAVAGTVVAPGLGTLAGGLAGLAAPELAGASVDVSSGLYSPDALARIHEMNRQRYTSRVLTRQRAGQGLQSSTLDEYHAALAAENARRTPEQVAQVLGLPAYAQGGIIRRPTIALVGERGPEAVTPLSGPGGLGPVTISMPITVYGADADTGRRLGEQVEPYIYAALERLAVQAGRI